MTDLDKTEEIANSGRPFVSEWSKSTVLALIAEVRALRAQNFDHETAIAALTAEAQSLRDRDIKLFYELEGVIIDTERGHGFDEVCLNTIKRVRDALGGAK